MNRPTLNPEEQKVLGAIDKWHLNRFQRGVSDKYLDDMKDRLIARLGDSHELKKFVGTGIIDLKEFASAFTLKAHSDVMGNIFSGDYIYLRELEANYLAGIIPTISSEKDLEYLAGLIKEARPLRQFVGRVTNVTRDLTQVEDKVIDNSFIQTFGSSKGYADYVIRQYDAAVAAMSPFDRGYNRPIVAFSRVYYDLLKKEVPALQKRVFGDLDIKFNGAN